MFTTTFWVAFGSALLVALGISFYYGRHAIHPRLRPHFGQVVILFLLLSLLSFCLALIISRMVGSPPVPRQLPAGEPGLPTAAGKSDAQAGTPVATPAEPQAPPPAPPAP
jgi:hypothetical protein